jgi:BirA family biotin operon repressor/biotin-[acetyl-CoA-carboxylase] ligase
LSVSGPDSPEAHSVDSTYLTRLAVFGKLYLFPSVGSTNDIARQLKARGTPALVVAETQTKGRGRFGRVWESRPGGLYFSLLLFPDSERKALCGLIALLAGLACVKSVERNCSLKSEIAWPNDVLVAHRKLAGFLCESKGQALIVGCGINVNQEGFPRELTEATSLRILTGREYDRYALLASFLAEFKHLYDDLKPQNLLPLLGEIKAHTSMLNHPVQAEVGFPGLGTLGARKITGTALDIDNTGRLILRAANGRVVALSEGTVRRIR